ncbi:MAG TPA: hypothetical protein PKJ08_00130 [Candidatus Cloacimonadota bacterium]|nr:hypothetical protein [Candidatus Cloacimonadota bacterium]
MSAIKNQNEQIIEQGLMVSKKNEVVVRDPRVIDLFEQLRLMISGGQRLTDNEALALANFAIKEGLDPMNGECWLLKSRNPDGTYKIAGIMVGIKGLRRKAQEALDKISPGNFFNISYKDINPPSNEYEIAIEATLNDSVSTRQYIENRQLAYQMMKDMPGDKYDAINKMVGESGPKWIGYGFYRKDEHNISMDKKFTPRERAMKRAEASVIRQRFNLNYNYRDDNGAVIEITQGEKAQSQHDAPPAMTFEIPNEIISTAAEKPSTRSSDQTITMPRPMQPEDLKTWLNAEVKSITAPANDRQRALLRGVLEGCFGGTYENPEAMRHMVTNYLTGNQSVRDLTDAWVLCLLNRWLKPVKDSGGLYRADPIANKEANLIAEMLRDAQDSQEGEEYADIQ